MQHEKIIKHMKVRLKAIMYACKYGLLPYWLYEQRRHYSGGYRNHLMINIKYAIRWATFNELQSDIDFEREVNRNF